MGEWLHYNFATGIFTQRNFVADVNCLIQIEFYSKTKIRFLSHPLEDLWLTYTLYL